MPDEREEHIKCVLTGKYIPGASKDVYVPEHKTWCGRETIWLEWVFTDASHAVLNEAACSRLGPCPQCIEAIVTTLRSRQTPAPPRSAAQIAALERAADVLRRATDRDGVWVGEAVDALAALDQPPPTRIS